MKFKISIKLQVKSKEFLMLSPLFILKCQDIRISEQLYVYSSKAVSYVRYSMYSSNLQIRYFSMTSLNIAPITFKIEYKVNIIN